MPELRRNCPPVRLLSECYPLAWLVEQAGGMATSGEQRILDVPPQSLHQRSALFTGPKPMAEEREALIHKHALPDAEALDKRPKCSRLSR